jgi:4-amino-4-deoxychorismate lyase
MTALIALAVSGRGVVDPAEPVLRADDDALVRGRAAFETLRVYGGRPFRLRQHLERLARSAEAVGLSRPPTEELTELARLALEAADVPDAVLRLYWTAGAPGADDGDPMGLALVSRIPDWIEPARAAGIKLVSLIVPRRSEPWLLPGTKSTSYAVNIAAEREAKRRGADDALFVDTSTVVLEGPVTNIWWRVARTLHTPSLELGILAGETRAAVIDLAPGLGYSVTEGTYRLDDLIDAEEMFTSSSVRELLPVVELDGRVVRRGPAATELQRALRNAAGSVDDQIRG